ncbi:NTP transferase domain-containing protein [Gluconacetobacter sp. Hr-1-5]|uniref:NTP transferase domain-containing protein n=1 Tax=Gluconacetobacter sp. Hr-1-5 TaxID=3395370 RepID=UPI003B5163DE
MLAGGASRRMGQDKAALSYDGHPQLARAFALLTPRVTRSFVSLRVDQMDDPLRRALPCIVDTLASIGPAAGLLAAHAACPDVAWLVLACDLPLLDGLTLDALTQARGDDCSAVAFRSEHDGEPEPLCAIWEPGALETLRREISHGRGSLRTILAGVGKILPPHTPGALDNINTPADRTRAMARLAGARDGAGQEHKCRG